MATDLSQSVAAALRQVALDQIAQDMDNNAKFATKAELEAVGGGNPGTVLIEQVIAFYNGYNGTSLDYRDYLDQQISDAENAFYSLGSAYNGVTV